MDLMEKFNPRNLKNLKFVEFESLTIEMIGLLAMMYPYMNGELIIQKADGTGVKSPASYRSLNSLLKGGHKFKIVGTKYGEPKPNPIEVDKEVSKIDGMEMIYPKNLCW
jgi:hypothetical protein